MTTMGFADIGNLDTELDTLFFSAVGDNAELEESRYISPPSVSSTRSISSTTTRRVSRLT